MKKRKAQENPALAFLRRRGSVLLGFALFALLVHDIFGDHGFLAMRRAQKEVEQLQQEIQELNEENARLAEQVKALKTDPRIIERIARDELGLAKPGELIFKLPPKPQEPAKQDEQKE
jgi:cell division protein FtsB